MVTRRHILHRNITNINAGYGKRIFHLMPIYFPYYWPFYNEVQDRIKNTRNVASIREGYYCEPG